MTCFTNQSYHHKNKISCNLLKKNNELMLIKLKKYFEDNRNDNILYT